ncbi:hypothetical protein JD844_008924 [Phrynosoma platyrhinos]|uniref:Uncharacterized protein n=1 Tax=Phrynosoma platyrhinos TaxID=52577 RepID=A0ABQ7TEG6_PHRPL|nr:hypothetical protein JD844_008924 [Phrynosoma platyrhinos]
MTNKAASFPVKQICATAWRRIAWAASTPAPNAIPPSVGQNVAATEDGCTIRFRQRLDTLSDFHFETLISNSFLDILLCKTVAEHLFYFIY